MPTKLAPKIKKVASKNKKAEPATPTQYLASIGDEARRADMEAIHRLIRKTVPELEPHVASGMIGYGRFHYRYATGHEGDTSVIGIASRAQYISLYLCGTKNGKYVAETYRAKLPKANIGKCCVRFKRLTDVDPKTLAKLLVEGSKNPAGKVG